MGNANEGFEQNLRTPSLESASERPLIVQLGKPGQGGNHEPGKAGGENGDNTGRKIESLGFPQGETLLAAMPDEAKPEAGLTSTKRVAEPIFPIHGGYDSVKPYRNSDGTETTRAKELDQKAQSLLTGNALPDRELSLKDHGKIMEAIANDSSLSEADKFYVYKQVIIQEAKGRDDDGLLLPGSTEYRVKFDLAKPTGLPESLKGDVVRHIIIDPTNDGYHGSLVYGDPPFAALWQSGTNGVLAHEVAKMLKQWGQFNDGDYQASLRQLECLKAMQAGGFNAYAKSWIANFAK